MSELPEEVDLHQERVNTLHLLFAEVPEYEQAVIVRDALNMRPMWPNDIDFLDARAASAMAELNAMHAALSVGSGAFPMGILAGSRLQENLGRIALMVSEMHTIIGNYR